MLHPDNQLTVFTLMYMPYDYRCECTENEEKAVAKRDEIKKGMKEMTDKLNAINEEKQAKTKEYKKIFK